MGYRDYSTAKGHIVDSTGHGDFTTIGAALTAATSGQTIFIRPGTYTENPALVAGVNLAAYDGDAFTPNVIINGECTFSAAGTVSITGIQLQTNSNFCLSVSGSAASIVYLNSCYINCLNNTGISFSSSSSSSGITFAGCLGNIATTGIAFISSSSAGNVYIRGGEIFNNGLSTTANTFSAGNLFAEHVNFNNPFTFSSTGSCSCFCWSINCGAVNATALTYNNTSTAGFCSYFRAISGTATAISIGSGATFEVDFLDAQSSNTSAITGSGTIKYGLITYSGTSSTNNVTTQTPYNTQPGTLFTWTPTVLGSSTAGTATYSAQNGLYSVFGRTVTIIFQVAWTSGTGTGNLLVGGLPFTSNATNLNATSAPRLDNVTLPASTVNLVGQVVVNSTTISFVGSTIAGAATAVAYSASGTAYMSVTYFI